MRTAGKRKMEFPMTLLEKAERLFKRKAPLDSSSSARAEYDKRARAEGEKTLRLRALRLAHERVDVPTEREETRRRTD
jgi:hypothetical protein